MDEFWPYDRPTYAGKVTGNMRRSGSRLRDHFEYDDQIRWGQVFAAIGIAIIMVVGAYRHTTGTAAGEEPAEDSPSFDCAEHGNGLCGPLSATREGDTYFVYDADGNPIGLVEGENITTND